MNTFSQQSMLDVAYNILNQKNDKMKLNDLIDQVFEELQIVDSNSDIRTELYLEIMTSGKFVYLGHEEWDIKLKHSLKEYAKDPVEFLSKEELNQWAEEEEVVAEEDEEYDSYDDDEDFDSDNNSYYNPENDDEESSSYNREGFGNEDEDDEYYDDDDFDNNDSFDEDSYNEYMDEYESRYDD